MFVRMCWKEAQKKFDAREDFSITCGNHAQPYEPCYYARDYYVGKYDFMTTLEVLSIYNDASVTCWKQVPEGTEEPKGGKLFRTTVWDNALLLRICEPRMLKRQSRKHMIDTMRLWR